MIYVLLFILGVIITVHILWILHLLYDVIYYRKPADSKRYKHYCARIRDTWDGITDSLKKEVEDHGFRVISCIESPAGLLGPASVDVTVSIDDKIQVNYFKLLYHDKIQQEIYSN